MWTEIKTIEEFEKLLEPDKNRYFFDGSLKILCNINVKFSIEITKSLWIKAGGGIEAGGWIKAGGGIEAGGWIEAGGGIKAGEWIEAGEWIKAGGAIKTGGGIEAGGGIFSFTFAISAKWISSKILPFWRQYWAEMPPLKKWRKDILNHNNCWDKLRGLPTKDEALEICQWDGWHWILRGQLGCFFGLIDKFEPPKN